MPKFNEDFEYNEYGNPTGRDPWRADDEWLNAADKENDRQIRAAYPPSGLTPTFPVNPDTQAEVEMRVLRYVAEDTYYALEYYQDSDRRKKKADLLKKLYGGPLNMKDYEALEAQAKRLLKYAEEARAELARWGDDDFPDGAVITFTKRFPGGTVDYNYAAIKTIHHNVGEDVELWYTTGPKAPKGYTWEELTKWMGNGVEEVFYVTALEKFVG